ncbi:DinB family protein [Chitinophaga cymbidii]|uniref:DinB-like domain-containing protein n=1 Tax=Chitinophaga cymbidii TaxID=1096750 RepID=A0A512RQ79_9BACT|nr:DinB family protein [Chitinophaga cymbidii]GEP97853.1 hypothetical protein CCY01nite_41130 [Chitinophaga cymbidii]
MNREQLLADIQTTVSGLMQTLSSFNDDQINKVPFEGSWTAGQVAEHVLKSSGIAEILHGKVEQPNRAPDQYVAPLREQFLNFDIKMKSPDFILPSDGAHDKEELMAELESIWKKTAAAAATLDLSMMCLDFELPTLGTMTRYEWIRFLVVHTQRHTHQLKNIHKAVA